MIKFTKTIFQFLSFSTFFYVIMVIIWGSYLSSSPLSKNLNYRIGSPGFLFTRLKEIKTVKNVDLIFIGSSHCYRSFDPRLFKDAGIKTFNLGSSAQTPIQTEFLLREYLDSLNPKIVIFEVNPIIFSLDGIESTLDIISNESNNIESIKLAIKQNHLKIYNTLIYAFYKKLLTNEKSNFVENKEKGNDTYVRGGFVERKLMFNEIIDFKKQNLKINVKQFNSLNNIVRILNERNIKLILIQAPVTSGLYNTIHVNVNFDSIMQVKGNYYNFNNLIKLNDSLHFFDADHLNQNGVKIFNDSIINILSEYDSLN